MKSTMVQRRHLWRTARRFVGQSRDVQKACRECAVVLTLIVSSVTYSSEEQTSLDFAQVVFVKATQSSSGSWCFDATVEHNDNGWEHYADGWEVVSANNQQVAFRELLHPHDNEQPFTRSQCGIALPDNAVVTVRAKCNVHGYGGASVVVDLSQEKGAGFEVLR